MAGKSFQADVDRIFVNTEKRLNLVMKQSLIRSINEMQLVGPSVASTKAAIKTGLGGTKKQPIQGPVPAAGKGGRMRVDTGFLRASGRASFNGMPTGPSKKPEDATTGKYSWSDDTTVSLIGNMRFGQTFYWGWTANYARYREKYDGFMETVLQKWQQTVDGVIAEAKKRFS